MVSCSPGACWTAGTLCISHRPLHLLLHAESPPSGEDEAARPWQCGLPLCHLHIPFPWQPLGLHRPPSRNLSQLAVNLSNGPWEPIPKESDCTTVKFLLEGKEFELYLTEALGFICLTPVLMEELEEEPLIELHKLCRQLQDTMHKSLILSAEDVLGKQFSQTAKIVFGFECGCGRVPHLVTPASAEGKSLICQATHNRHKILKKQRIWFSPVDGVEVSS